MKDVNALKLIDDVLECFNTVVTDEPKSVEQIRNKYIEYANIKDENSLTIRDVYEICVKLEKDGFLNPHLETDTNVNKPIKDNKFYSSFDGRLFSSIGGYQEAKKVSDLKNKQDIDFRDRSQKIAVRLNDLTKYLAIGTFLLSGIEIVKMFLGHQCH